jgi:hypothetical protein
MQAFGVRRSRAARGALAAAVAGVVLLSGCADGERTREAQQSPLPLAGTWRAGLFVQGYGPQGLAPSSTASPSASASTDPSLSDPQQKILAPLGLVQADVTNGYRVDLAAKGTSLMEKTLAFCGKDYPSEEAREARRRSVLVGPDGQLPGVLSEAVLYTTPKAAAAALDELRAATRSCDAAVPLDTDGDGVAVTITQTGTDGIDVRGFVPPSDRVLIATTLTETKTKASATFITLYQVRGRVMVALYFQNPDGAAFTAAELGDLHALGVGIAKRLASMDAAVADGGP